MEDQQFRYWANTKTYEVAYWLDLDSVGTARSADSRGSSKNQYGADARIERGASGPA
jgi:hypothetical protein